MLKKGSKLYSILTGTCPKCHEESMYCEKNPYKLSSIYKMHDTCSHCETKYMIEPSFFYGAMYVSYGVTVAIGVAIFVTLNVRLAYKNHFYWNWSWINCIYACYRKISSKHLH